MLRIPLDFFLPRVLYAPEDSSRRCIAILLATCTYGIALLVCGKVRVRLSVGVHPHILLFRCPAPATAEKVAHDRWLAVAAPVLQPSQQNGQREASSPIDLHGRDAEPGRGVDVVAEVVKENRLFRTAVCVLEGPLQVEKLRARLAHKEAAAPPLILHVRGNQLHGGQQAQRVPSRRRRGRDRDGHALLREPLESLRHSIIAAHKSIAPELPRDADLVSALVRPLRLLEGVRRPQRVVQVQNDDARETRTLCLHGDFCEAQGHAAPTSWAFRRSIDRERPCGSRCFLGLVCVPFPNQSNFQRISITKQAFAEFFLEVYGKGNRNDKFLSNMMYALCQPLTAFSRASRLLKQSWRRRLVCHGVGLGGRCESGAEHA
eukprot:scaffold1282_cov251-Pinguiococcus_pyrenoidosus.AAC.31